MTKYLKTKPGSLEDNYQQMFKKELEKSGKSLGSMSDQEKKNFFWSNAINLWNLK